MKKLLILNLIGLFFSNIGLAGQEAKGGNGVRCDGKKSVMLDYYDAGLPTLLAPNPVIDSSAYTLQEMRIMILERIAEVAPYFAYEFSQVQNLLGTHEHWRLTDLKDIHDANEVYQLPSNCQLFQAAVRQGKTMYLDPNWMKDADASQLAILEAHEYLYYLVQSKTPTMGAEQVRKILRPLLSQNFNLKELAESLREIGALFYVYESFTTNMGATYFNPNTEVIYINLTYKTSPYTGKNIIDFYYIDMTHDVNLIDYCMGDLDCNADVCTGKIHARTDGGVQKCSANKVTVYNITNDGKSATFRLDSLSPQTYISH